MEKKLLSLYRSPNLVRLIKSRNLRRAGDVARIKEGGSAFKILTNKPTGKRLLGRPGHRWKNNIKVDPKEIGVNIRNWIYSAQGWDYWRVMVNVALNLQVT